MSLSGYVVCRRFDGNWILTTDDYSEGIREIVDWLGADVGADSEYYIRGFEEISEGRKKAGYFGTGNAHSIFTTRKYILIECEYGDQYKVLMTIAQAISTIRLHEKERRELRAISGHIPKPFIVEYEAEGSDAERRFAEAGGVQSNKDIFD